MRHASLFSGIGGFDLAASWLEWENVLSCEFDPFCQSILRHHFPTTTHYGDIRELDGTPYRGAIDVLTGGFPCQPFSAAGKRGGTADNRFLWPEMLRVIREIQPTWIVAENVRGITSIDNGVVFERVCAELEANEYEVQPFCIPACSVGAPHKRERIWFVAHAKSIGRRNEQGNIQEQNGRPSEQLSKSDCTDQCSATDTANDGCSRQHNDGQRESSRESGSERIRTGFLNKAERQDRDAADTISIGRERRRINRKLGAEETEESRKAQQRERNGDTTYNCCWQEHWLQAATRLCGLYDGVSCWLERNLQITSLPQYAVSARGLTKQDLPVLWQSIQSSSLWQSVRRCDEVQKQKVLLAILCKLGRVSEQVWLSEASEEGGRSDYLPDVFKNGGSGSPSQERGLDGQRTVESRGTLPPLSHAIALDAVETYARYFNPKWRKESLKAYGNAIVPQVAYQIFKAIQNTYE